jgi:ABC-type uncharacterized transport system permease subunit
MLRLTRKLIPPFLIELDRRWLLSRPHWWATRIHLVLFFGLGGLLSCLVIAFMPTVAPHSLPEGWHFALALGIPALMGLGSLYFLVMYFPALIFHVNDPPSL